MVIRQLAFRDRRDGLSDSTVTLTGTFPSSTAASGTLTLLQKTGACTGTQVNATWTATKRR